MSLLEICQFIENSQIGTAIRESIYVFPIIEGTHVLALGISVGAILWFDLRAIGINMRRQPVSEVYAQVKPLMIGGFTIMFLTGILLFWSHAAQCYINVFFRYKFAAMFLAGLNAAFFHVSTQRSINNWDKSPVPSVPVRVAGFLSIILWTVVVAAGRLMVYSF